MLAAALEDLRRTILRYVAESSLSMCSRRGIIVLLGEDSNAAECRCPKVSKVTIAETETRLPTFRRTSRAHSLWPWNLHAHATACINHSIALHLMISLNAAWFAQGVESTMGISTSIDSS